MKYKVKLYFKHLEEIIEKKHLRRKYKKRAPKHKRKSSTMFEY